MYIAVKGGERAIEASWRLLEASRRGDPSEPALTVRQIRQQMRLAVSRVMTEGSVYDEELAALAIKQAAGDLPEAIFLLRAYRTTLPRFGYSVPVDSEKMNVERRISAAFKEIPGGQLLGPTYDYTQRLLDFSLLDGDSSAANPDTEEGGEIAGAATGVAASEAHSDSATPRVLGLLAAEGLMEHETSAARASAPPDLTETPLLLPAPRALRLQNLARADEGFLLSLGYSTQRGYGDSHPFAGEIRFGCVAVEMEIPELKGTMEIGDIEMTECSMVNEFGGSAMVPPTFTQGYGLAFGHSERKAMSMALVDRAMRAEELGEAVETPAQDIDFVLYHSDNVEASGFVQHLKLPHYVDFQAKLELVRRMRADHPALRKTKDSAEVEE
ncbi:carbon-phosphorus lyase complex subunit PhnI [Burkholderia contaminans]|uniref:Carbon-phosphorus lyase complex subunit PhnI n=1 Tax=Burkholderia contaminans TaxID=488447 RepID=A0A3N8PTM2_9BURK|nr:carbon-phosphorus lyase complex subunit PhnI [Burkholderia contaminans]RQT14962.1 carbon-phosphorus lyase complex subunit PhnI [Burkholderia contaminans]